MNKNHLPNLNLTDSSKPIVHEHSPSIEIDIERMKKALASTTIEIPANLSSQEIVDFIKSNAPQQS